MQQLLIYYSAVILFAGGYFFSVSSAACDTLDWIEVSTCKTHFVKKKTNKPVVFWGANYDHDTKMRLIDDYWINEWNTVVKDFDEMKNLGLNIVRIHLQLGRFMDSPSQANRQSLNQLSKLIHAAEKRGIYLYVTGLACYKKSNIPDWYDTLNETERWAVQAAFWKHVARVCKSSPAVFCYDLMNEPLVPNEQTGGWLTPNGLENLFYVQKITRNPNGRKPHVIAKAWIDCLVKAIRSVDQRHLITVGVIPWAIVQANAKPLFYDPVVAENLDFVSVHFYPESQKIDKALKSLKVYAIGKPIIIAEIFPMKCSIKEMDHFIDCSRSIAQGFISFYWGKTIEEYTQIQSPTISESLMKEWLNYLKSKREN
ncbi:MAG: glycoside hydrolase family 5 protein [Planctomycetaceae bacterium]|jgi:hypothetical protein|nr:glycoside hydrolase family 5 protein [Planctomycetaceae bacterium]